MDTKPRQGKQAVAQVLDEGICFTGDDADEFLDQLEQIGFQVVPIPPLSGDIEGR